MMTLSHRWMWAFLPLFWVAMVGCDTNTVDDDTSPDVNVETDSDMPGTDGVDVDVDTPATTDQTPALTPPAGTGSDATTPPPGTGDNPTVPDVDVDVNTEGSADSTGKSGVPEVDVDAGAATKDAGQGG